MRIKNLFDDLKRIGKKAYYSRNNEEEIYFSNGSLMVEIFCINEKLDIVINLGGVRSNYLQSATLTEDQREQIRTTLNSYISLDVKCKTVSQVLLEVFMDHKNECLNLIQSIKNTQLSGIDFVRGLGIVENRLVLSFAADLDKIDIEVETNFRIRNDEKHFLSYNDLYLDTKRREMSVKRFRSQTNIEKSYLCSQLELINKELKGLKPRKVVLKEYGDIYIVFGKRVVVEIFNDTHLEDAVLYRIVHTNGSFSESYECLIKNNEVVYI